MKIGRITFGPLEPSWRIPQEYLDQSARLTDQQRRIDEAARVLLDDTAGTPQERATQAVRILRNGAPCRTRTDTRSLEG